MIPSPIAAGSPALITFLLGLLQGLTEFLPISSSGHLVLAQTLLRSPTPGIALEVILHAGTLLAVLVAFRGDLWTMARAAARAVRRPLHPTRDEADPQIRRAVGEIGLLFLATLPVALVGLLWSEPIEVAFESPRVAASMLGVTGVLLLATRWAPRGKRQPSATIAAVMGLMQVVSLLPGVSRSGATISGGLFAGGGPREMARFSFLMSVPAILGSVLIELPQLAREWEAGRLVPYGIGFGAAFLAGLVAIRILLGIVGRGRFFLFGIYCLLAGLLAWLSV